MNEVIERYVRIVRSGRMKLEDVPERYRQQVAKIIHDSKDLEEK